MDSHQDKINMTQALKALSPYLENPRRIVIQNEAFVIVAAATLFLQLMLGPWRRRSGHWFVQGTLWVAYTASFPLITYTLGQMVTSPVKNMLHPFWAMILFWAAGCANAFMAYDIDDNKQWKRYYFELVQYSTYLFLTYGSVSQSFDTPFFLLVLLVSAGNFIRILSSWMVTNSTPSKLLADYMRDQVQVSTRSRAAQEETFTMNNCKYLVRHPFMDPNNNLHPFTDLFYKDGAITVEAIWSMTFDDDSLLKKQLRDVCLSFALSHLLRRRYFEMDCAEAGLPKTLEFALQGLLPEEDQANHYSGAFHVIEVELGFLYDFFFTKHATLLHRQSRFLMLVVSKLICASFVRVRLILHPPTVNKLDPIIEVATRSVDVTVTVIIMGALIVFEALQAIHYLTSDWATISLACSYTRGDTCKLMPSIIRFLRRFRFDNFLGMRINLFGYWKNKMGQTSVIGGNLLVHRVYVGHTDGDMDLVLLTKHHGHYLIYSMIFSMKNFVAAPDLVKSQIVSCLRTYGNCGGPLTNGKAALERNDVHGDFSSTLENDSQIKVMLIWHIATEYCKIASSDGAEEGLQRDEQQVATTLSNYCVYLMYFIPQLLAENATDTLFIIHNVVKEVQNALGGDKPSKDRLLRVIQDFESIMSNQDQTAVHDFDCPDNHATIIDIPSVSNNRDNIIHDFGGSGSGITDNIIHDSNGGSSNTDNITHDHDSDGSGNTDNTTIAQDSATNNNEDSIFIQGLKLGRSWRRKVRISVGR